MAHIVDLTTTFSKCLPEELSKHLLDEYNCLATQVSYEGKNWNVCISVKSDESSTCIRAESEGIFHLWNCIPHPSEKDRIKVFHFNGPLTSECTIAYDTKGQQFSKLLIEGQVKGPEASFHLAEKTSGLAMRWIQEQGLEECAEELTKRKFTPPKQAPSTFEQQVESSKQPYPLALKLAAIALALFLAYKVSSYILKHIQNRDHLTGMVNVQ